LINTDLAPLQQSMDGETTWEIKDLDSLPLPLSLPAFGLAPLS
jgi:hypothetical protein